CQSSCLFHPCAAPRPLHSFPPRRSSDLTRLLAAACANCHGTDGKLGGAIPAIAGRPASVLENQLQAFKQGQVANATIMDRISRGYSDDELKRLAQHFSRITR